MHLTDRMFVNQPRPLLMGILNVTRDSFSDGNRHFTFNQALARAKQIIAEGADILDIGGESSRPGSTPVSPEEENRRVIPVICAVREFSAIPISVDTTKAEVARLAIESGANIVNDISGLRFDPELAALVAKHPDVCVVIMHMQGTPADMQDNPHYDDVVKEIKAFFLERSAYALNHGIRYEQLIFDPGIGFGKLPEHNISILRYLDRLRVEGLPLLIGASRKRFINDIHPSAVTDRIGGSLAAVSACMKSADIIRVHDVLATRQFMAVFKRLTEAG